MVLSAPVRLPVRVLARIASTSGLGDLHPTLAPAATWRPPGGPDPLHDAVDEQLSRLGWLCRDGSLDREVRASLSVLCRPTVEFYGWLTREGATTAVLAAAIGREAVLAVRWPASTVRLRTVPARRLAERLVAELPDTPPGVEPPMTVALADLHATRRDGRTREAGGVVARRAHPDVRRARRIIDLPTTGAGELYVGIRDGHDRRLTHEQPVEYVDSVAGRFVSVKPDPAHVRISPARPADVLAELRHRHRLLVGTR